MDFNNLVNKVKEALGKNPSIIDKAGDFVDSKTDGKYSAQVDKAGEAAKKFVGGQQGGQEGGQPEAPKPDDQQQ